MPNFEDIDPEHSRDLDRRSFLRATGIVAAATMTGRLSLPGIAKQTGGASAKPLVSGRRKLGQLEVSSLGLGCQDFTGTFYATHPNRADRTGASASPRIRSTSSGPYASAASKRVTPCS
jgi:hypothetical protein